LFWKCSFKNNRSTIFLFNIVVYLFYYYIINWKTIAIVNLCELPVDSCELSKDLKTPNYYLLRHMTLESCNIWLSISFKYLKIKDPVPFSFCRVNVSRRISTIITPSTQLTLLYILCKQVCLIASINNNLLFLKKKECLELYYRYLSCMAHATLMSLWHLLADGTLITKDQ